MGLGCFTTAEVLAGDAVMESYEPAPGVPEPSPANTGYERVAGGVDLAGGRIFGLVPDGVASVRVTDEVGSVTAAVAGNFFQAAFPSRPAKPGGEPGPGGQPAVEWLDSSGGEVAQTAAPGNPYGSGHAAS